jgi:hypothetical protein
MRRRLVILLSLAVTALLLLPALAVARDSTAAEATIAGGPPPLPDVTAVYGKPWTGSYLRKVPSTLTRTKVRNIWVKWRGIFNTWADGGPGWKESAGDDTLPPRPSLSGNISRVLQWEYGETAWYYDPADTGGWFNYMDGRAKVRLAAGNGKKVIKLRFKMAVYSDSAYTPNYPISPTYTKTVTLAM